MIRAVIVLALVLPAGIAHADLATAKRLYDEAKAEKDPQRQIALLEQSVEAEPTFEAYLALGDAQNGRKAHPAARESLKKALELAGNDKARARATYVTAETFVAEGHRGEAIALFRRSLAFHPYPNVAERLREIELQGMDTPVTAEEIAGALSSTATRGFYVVASSVDLRIGFSLDSAELDAKGTRQARELGKALSAPALAGKSFEIVGHTDKHGDDPYNERLSQRRADAVRSFLVREFKIPEGRLTAVGRGKRELLYRGDSESDHALNRRVEIKVK